jgi:hypothetical protein
MATAQNRVSTPRLAGFIASLSAGRMNKLDAGEILNAGRKKNSLFRALKKTNRGSEVREGG